MTMEPHKGYFIEGAVLLVQVFSRTGMLVEVSWWRAILVRSWKSRARSFTSSPSASKDWRNGLGWRLRGRGGRMPGSATELNGQVLPTLLSQVWQLFGNRDA